MGIEENKSILVLTKNGALFLIQINDGKETSTTFTHQQALQIKSNNLNHLLNFGKRKILLCSNLNISCLNFKKNNQIGKKQLIDSNELFWTSQYMVVQCAQEKLKPTGGPILLEQKLFTSIFSQQASLVDEKFVIIGDLDGKVSYVPLKKIRSANLSSEIKDIAKIDQPIKKILSSRIGTGNKLEPIHNALIIVGVYGKILFIHTKNLGLDNFFIKEFNLHCKIDDIYINQNCTICYLHCGKLYFVDLLEIEEATTTESTFILTTSNSTNSEPKISSLLVPKHVQLSAKYIVSIYYSNSAHNKILFIDSQGRIYFLPFESSESIPNTQKTSPSTQQQKMKDNLSKLDKISEVQQHYSTIESLYDTQITEINRIIQAVKNGKLEFKAEISFNSSVKYFSMSPHFLLIQVYCNCKENLESDNWKLAIHFTKISSPRYKRSRLVSLPPNWSEETFNLKMPFDEILEPGLELLIDISLIYSTRLTNRFCIFPLQNKVLSLIDFMFLTNRHYPTLLRSFRHIYQNPKLNSTPSPLTTTNLSFISPISVSLSLVRFVELITKQTIDFIPVIKRTETEIQFCGHIFSDKIVFTLSYKYDSNFRTGKYLLSFECSSDYTVYIRTEILDAVQKLFSTIIPALSIQLKGRDSHDIQLLIDQIKENVCQQPIRQIVAEMTALQKQLNEFDGKYHSNKDYTVLLPEILALQKAFVDFHSFLRTSTQALYY